MLGPEAERVAAVGDLGELRRPRRSCRSPRRSCRSRARSCPSATSACAAARARGPRSRTPPTRLGRASARGQLGDRGGVEIGDGRDRSRPSRGSRRGSPRSARSVVRRDARCGVCGYVLLDGRHALISLLVSLVTSKATPSTAPTGRWLDHVGQLDRGDPDRLDRAVAAVGGDALELVDHVHPARSPGRTRCACRPATGRRRR